MTISIIKHSIAQPDESQSFWQKNFGPTRYDLEVTTNLLRGRTIHVASVESCSQINAIAQVAFKFIKDVFSLIFFNTETPSTYGYVASTPKKIEVEESQAEDPDAEQSAEEDGEAKKPAEWLRLDRKSFLQGLRKAVSNDGAEMVSDWERARLCDLFNLTMQGSQSYDVFEELKKLEEEETDDSVVRNPNNQESERVEEGKESPNPDGTTSSSGVETTIPWPVQSSTSSSATTSKPLSSSSTPGLKSVNLLAEDSEDDDDEAVFNQAEKRRSEENGKRSSSPTPPVSVSRPPSKPSHAETTGDEEKGTSATDDTPTTAAASTPVVGLNEID
ncbi:MAG: hypothetical protein WB791_06905 [Waddliaceae bacterium]